MLPSTQQSSFSSSVVIATTCFGPATIFKRHTVVYCLKLFAGLAILFINNKYEVIK
jgi:hypothetical protein